jgi:hypothetical protein
MRFLFFATLVVLCVGGGFLFWASRHLTVPSHVAYGPPPETLWNFQAIDTMKYSRDIAREKLGDASFDAVIEMQVKNIAETGATHVAIATPYDEEFVPFLRRWVEAARRHGLYVWFRGNWSGWEGWFEYPRLSREEHLKKTKDFIVKHPDFFEDGDVFSSCPECENGGTGDPRQTGDVAGYRAFLVAEYKAMQQSFKTINKDVRANFFSMNGDVARLVMDQATTKSLGGIVTIDHYVKTPEQLVKDVEDIAKKSGGRVVLGEFGAPIPDIHGALSEEQQALWIGQTLELLSQSRVVEGVSYWLSVGGSTEIWKSTGTPHQAVATLHEYFRPGALYGVIRDELARPIAGATVHLGEQVVTTDAEGHYALLYRSSLIRRATVTASGYVDQAIDITARRQPTDIILEKKVKDWEFRLLELAR